MNRYTKVINMMESYFTKDFEKAKKYVIDNNLELPVYYPKTTDLPELFNVRGIPATFIFNEQGQLIKSTEGADNYDTDAYRQLLK